MLGSIKFVREHVVAFLAFERQAQGLPVKGPRDLDVLHDRGNARQRISSYNRNLWMHHLNGDAAYLPV